MGVFTVIAGLLSAFLLAYLFYAMFFPENF